MKHSPFGFSQLYKRDLCPASYKEEQGLPEQDSEVAKNGNFIHACVAEGKFEHDGIIATDSEKELIVKCLNFALDFVEGKECQVFKELTLPVNHDGQELLFGTIDYLIYYHAENRAVCIDWKTGFKEVDEAQDNWQLASMSVAISQKFPCVNSVESIIYNPRINQDTRHTYTEFNAILANLKALKDRCESEQPEYNSSEKACQYCRAKLKCPETIEQLATIEKVVDLPAIPDDKLNELFERSKVVSKVIDAIQDELKSRIKLNGSCGVYGIKQTSGGFEIINIPEAFKASGLTKDAFWNCITVSDSKLKEEVIKLYPDLTKKEAEKLYLKALSAYRQEKKPRESIVTLS